MYLSIQANSLSAWHYKKILSHCQLSIQLLESPIPAAPALDRVPVSEPVSEKFGIEKSTGIGIENI